jgi:energy-coupling factor transporter ATP-binding protein EcfA2
MLINYEKVTAHLQDIRTGKIKEGLTLGVPEIDDYFRFKPSSFNIILGHSNTGKTTIVLYLMLAYAIKHQIKWLVFSSENEAYSIIRKLVEFLEERPIQDVPEKQYKKHIDFIYIHFKIIDSTKLYTYRELLDLCKVIKDAWNYQGLLIDPYNSLIKDSKLISSVGGHEYDYQATTELRIFAKKNEISIWVNTHANTSALRMVHRIDHEYAGHPIPPNAADVEGGGKFVNRADDFLVVHRYIQHPTEFMYSLVHVRKVKETETGGRPTSIDEPIRLKALRNNVGFSIKNISVLKKIIQPF